MALVSIQPKPAGTPTWTDHASPDAAAARNFYHAVFGWQYDIGGPEFGGYTTARLGDRTVAGLSAIPESMAELKPSWGLYFASHDLNADETVATAVKHGGKQMGNIDDSPFGRIAALMDPFGAIFKVVQPPQG